MGLRRIRYKSLIMTLVSVLSIVLLTLGYTTIALGQTTLSATVKATLLKIRVSPSLRADVVTTLPRNSVVTLDGRNRTGSWLHGTAAGGQSGWMYRYYLKFPRGTKYLSLPILDTNTATSPTPAPTYAPITVQAAFQPFEKGMMIWRSDTKEIYVLFNPGVYSGSEGAVMQNGENPAYKNIPIDPANIPAGFYQPVNGFGRLWDNNPLVRDGLGWATAPESSYRMTIQRLGPFIVRYWGQLITLPDGRSINMGGSAATYWSFVK